jgi:hypothetical protein
MQNFSEGSDCHDRNKCHDHYCLIITPESIHTIFLFKLYQADKQEALDQIIEKNISSLSNQMSGKNTPSG